MAGDGVHDRDVDLLPHTVGLPVEEGAHRARGGDPPGKVHAHVASATQGGVLLRISHERGGRLPAHSAHVPCNQVRALPVPIRASVTERGDIGSNEFLGEVTDRAGVETESLCLFRLDIGDEYVGASDHIMNATAISRAVKIERQAALVGVEV